MKHRVFTELQKPEMVMKVPMVYLIIVVPASMGIPMLLIQWFAPPEYARIAILLALPAPIITWAIGAILTMVDPEFMKVLGSLLRTMRPSNWPLRRGKFYHG